MTVPSPSRHELAAAALASASSPSAVAAAARFVKNAAIGNPTKKTLYLHSLRIAPSLANCLRASAADPPVAAELATVVATLAHASDGRSQTLLAAGSDANAQTLIAAGVVPPLLDALAAQDPRLVDAGLRALRTFSQRSISACAQVFQPTHVCSLISLLAEPPSSTPDARIALVVHIAQIAASILARLAECSTDLRDSITTNAGIAHLLKWIDQKWSIHPKTQEAALDAIASLSKDNPRIAKSIALAMLPCGQRVISTLFVFVRDKRPSMRLVASACITHLHRAASIPRDQQPQVVLLIMPVLIRLFMDSSPLGAALTTMPTTVAERAMAVFSLLVSDSADLQLAAMEGDAIIKLVQILQNIGSLDASTDASGNPNSASAGSNLSGLAKSNKKQRETASAGPSTTSGDAPLQNVAVTAIDRHRENALLAISNACSLREECRKQAIDSKLLPLVVSLLSSRSPGVRAAACRCARSLSRSVKTLRTSLMDANIATPLFDLLTDDSIQVQIEASATLCNLVLDFSPMKKIVIERGAVGRFVELTDSADSALRLNAAWTLKNMAFQADSETKSMIIGRLGWDRLLRLVDDPEIPVQIQALNFIRNYACGKESDVDAVFKGFSSTDILAVLESKLQNMSTHTQIVLQTLFIVVNLCIGNAEHKTFIMSHVGLLQKVFGFLTHDDAQVRVAAAWCAINLSWLDESGAHERISVLKNLGIESVLQKLAESDEDMDVKDRASTALNNMRGAASSATATSTALAASGSSGDAQFGTNAVVVINSSDSASSLNLSETLGTNTPTNMSNQRLSQQSQTRPSGNTI